MWQLADWTDNRTTANQLCLQDEVITRVNSESIGNFILLFFFSACGYYCCHIPMTNQLCGRTPPTNRRWRQAEAKAIIRVRKLIGQRSTFAKPQGSETWRGLVYSFCGFSCVLIGRVCVYTANHQAAIFTIFIEIYAVFVFLLWSQPESRLKTRSVSGISPGLMPDLNIDQSLDPDPGPGVCTESWFYSVFWGEGVELLTPEKPLKTPFCLFLIESMSRINLNRFQTLNRVNIWWTHIVNTLSWAGRFEMPLRGKSLVLGLSGPISQRSKCKNQIDEVPLLVCY